MKNELENKNIDSLIKKVMMDEESPLMPMGFVDQLTRKFEKHTMKKRIWEEWSIKMMIIIGVTSCLAAVMYFTHQDMNALWKVEYLYPMLGLLTIAFIFFFDQVVLKWMFFINSQKKKHT